jgi:hypothetical protein
MENTKERVDYLAYEQFELANGYKSGIGLLKDIERSVLFEMGKQWVMDDDIEDYPKITLNIIKQIGKAKKSNIMQNKYGYLVNSTNFKSVRKIQDFMRYQAESVNLRKKDLKAVDDDYKKGTGIHYFYWDAEKRGFLKNSGGEMRVEVVDIRNFSVANSNIQEIQDQEWVQVVTRERINSLREKYPEKAEDIIPDGASYTASTDKEDVGMDGTEEFCNVYIKFFRNFEGQVFFETSTQYTVLKEATPLNPYYDIKKAKARAEKEGVGFGVEMPNTTSTMDDKDKKEQDDPRGNKVWNLYPFAKLALNERDNCFYGYPITMEYIEAQKSINNHYSVYDKALQDNVLGGYMYREGILDKDDITAENGQMIGLKTMPNERLDGAFGRIPVANVPQDSEKYSQSLIGMTRQVAGASNIMLGQSDFAGQSGKQTKMLMDRAKENSSDHAMLFNEFKREQAYIMFLFAKFFYDNEEFVIVEHGMSEDSVKNYMDKKKFVGTDYLDDSVLLDIQVGSAPSFTEFTNLELLGLMVQSGQLPFEVYLSMLPDGYVSNREELKKLAENNSNKVIEGLQKELKQATNVIDQMVKAYENTQKDRENIHTIITENNRLKQMLTDQTAETIDRVTKMSNQNKEMMTEMKNLLNIKSKGKQNPS